MYKTGNFDWNVTASTMVANLLSNALTATANMSCSLSVLTPESGMLMDPFSNLRI